MSVFLLYTAARASTFSQTEALLIIYLEVCIFNPSVRVDAIQLRPVVRLCKGYFCAM